MSSRCSECGGRMYIAVRGKGRGPQRTRRDHDLCVKCWRAFTSRHHAARKGPKPYWVAEEALAKVMPQTMEGENVW